MLAFAAIALAMCISVLDGAIVNVALPAIGADLQVSAAQSIWVVNAYQLAITVSLLPLAMLGDILGYKRVYMAGLAVFTLASLACAQAQSLDVLTAARVTASSFHTMERVRAAALTVRARFDDEVNSFAQYV